MQEPCNAPTLLTEAASLAEGDQTDRELVGTLRKLIRLESAVRAALSHAAAVAISQGAHESTGHSSAADLLRSECHLTGREAHELVVSAVRLREHLHCTFRALQSGVITWAHATTLVRAVDRLGLDTVLGAEDDWIELIATRTSPEALQRVVHTRRIEQVGYPDCRTPGPQATEERPMSPDRTDADSVASTDAPEAASTGNATHTHASAGSDDLRQDSRQNGMSDEQLRDVGDFRRPAPPTDGGDVEPDTDLAPEALAVPTLTLSSDNSLITAEEPTASMSGCMRAGCGAKASLREISFTVHWLDSSRSTILGCGVVCDEHAVALTSCSVDRIRVGHRTTIRTIGPALVTDAA